ncbi:hypothetical protein [Candidatus Phytoplasma pruni]|uniref:Uncharacterized protein n=1 Tax=Candidatus Phytoplasma pruni TaxID=479893 RepID=A0A851HL65_9MOLU|nr:hypothetical protein [Candidatus Phytoplasma pruni]NWN46139.1 hypothetical protein [Candidatus Phytoplasma pruni]
MKKLQKQKSLTVKLFTIILLTLPLITLVALTATVLERNNISITQIFKIGQPNKTEMNENDAKKLFKVLDLNPTENEIEWANSKNAIDFAPKTYYLVDTFSSLKKKEIIKRYQVSFEDEVYTDTDLFAKIGQITNFFIERSENGQTQKNTVAGAMQANKIEWILEKPNQTNTNTTDRQNVTQEEENVKKAILLYGTKTNNSDRTRTVNSLTTDQLKTHEKTKHLTISEIKDNFDKLKGINNTYKEQYKNDKKMILEITFTLNQDNIKKLFDESNTQTAPFIKTETVNGQTKKYIDLTTVFEVYTG